jgi:hypothetical protein
MKVKAYFSRVQPFYLLSKAECGDHEAFDAYPVEVDEVTLANVRSIRRLMTAMEEMFLEGGAPEDSAVTEAELFETEVRRIFKTKAQ